MSRRGPSLGPVGGPVGPGIDPLDPMEQEPLTRPEYISAMVHFYRGEMYRSQVWRTRLDTTTNWAVVTVAGMVSFAFSQPSLPADVVLIANVLVSIFLAIEARRYRYFAAFRARVRMIEENFYLPMLRRDLHSPRESWRESVADDLERPRFKITQWEAIMFRFRRNYVFLFGAIFVTWWAKLYVHPVPAESLHEVYVRTGLGGLSPAIATGLVLLFYGTLFGLLATRGGRSAAADEVHGLDRTVGRWNV